MSIGISLITFLKQVSCYDLSPLALHRPVVIVAPAAAGMRHPLFIKGGNPTAFVSINNYFSPSVMRALKLRGSVLKIALEHTVYHFIYRT